jgi:hypothetical protein
VPDTTYAVRRVSVTAALRTALVVGPAVALGPALLLAALLYQALAQVSRHLGGLAPVELRAVGQTIARLDGLALLELQDVAQTAGRLAALGGLTVLGLTLLLTLVGGLVVALAALLGALAYNAASAVTGGVAVELRARGHPGGGRAPGGPGG